MDGRWGTEPGNGIVIVACLANLRSLQLTARSAGMICQFLPLDYPGCQAHWRRARVPTTLNENELVRLVTVSAHANSRGRSPAFAQDATAASRT
jgi:hypothetical protein